MVESCLGHEGSAPERRSAERVRLWLVGKWLIRGRAKPYTKHPLPGGSIELALVWIACGPHGYRVDGGGWSSVGLSNSHASISSALATFAMRSDVMAESPRSTTYRDCRLIPARSASLLSESPRSFASERIVSDDHRPQVLRRHPGTVLRKIQQLGHVLQGVPRCNPATPPQLGGESSHWDRRAARRAQPRTPRQEPPEYAPTANGDRIRCGRPRRE